MKKPEPQIGQIIRFDYLWRDEAQQGRVEGAKERPCAVILAADKDDDGSRVVYVAPITHSAPRNQQQTIEIPAKDRRMTGLDYDRSWLITSEVNRVDWSDPGIVPAKKDQWLFGHLPRGVAKDAVNQVVAMSKNKLLGRVNRIEASRKGREEGNERGR